MDLRPVVLPAVLLDASASSSTAREQEATDSQAHVTTGAVGWRRPSGSARWTAPPVASRVRLSCGE